MMAWFERFFTRRRRSGAYGRVPDWAIPRLRDACCRLGEQEREMQRVLGLSAAPCLVLADEELGALIDATERRRVVRPE